MLMLLSSSGMCFSGLSRHCSRSSGPPHQSPCNLSEETLDKVLETLLTNQWLPAPHMTSKAKGRSPTAVAAPSRCCEAVLLALRPNCASCSRVTWQWWSDLSPSLILLRTSLPGSLKEYADKRFFQLLFVAPLSGVHT